jgi:hypothetical protein
VSADAGWLAVSPVRNKATLTTANRCLDFMWLLVAVLGLAVRLSGHDEP